MKQKSTTAYAYPCDRERNAELVGVLTAISIVSKRLAGRLAAHSRCSKNRCISGLTKS